MSIGGQLTLDAGPAPDPVCCLTQEHSTEDLKTSGGGGGRLSRQYGTSGGCVALRPAAYLLFPRLRCVFRTEHCYRRVPMTHLVSALPFSLPRVLLSVPLFSSLFRSLTLLLQPRLAHLSFNVGAKSYTPGKLYAAKLENFLYELGEVRGKTTNLGLSYRSDQA